MNDNSFISSLAEAEDVYETGQAEEVLVPDSRHGQTRAKNGGYILGYIVSNLEGSS